MTDHYNSARRIHTILSKAARMPAGRQALDVWAETFSLQGKSSPQRDQKIAMLLGLLMEEIEQTYARMEENTQLQRTDYSDAFEEAIEAVKIQNLLGQWSIPLSNLSASNLTSLHYCARLSPHEEQPIRDEDLARLSAQIAELRTFVNEHDLPREVKSFLYRQIQILENAVLSYQVQGNRAFTTGAALAGTEIALNENLFEKNENKGDFKDSLQRIANVWTWIKERNSDVDVVLRIYGGTHVVAQVASAAINSLGS